MRRSEGRRGGQEGRGRGPGDQWEKRGGERGGRGRRGGGELNGRGGSDHRDIHGDGGNGSGGCDGEGAGVIERIVADDIDWSGGGGYGDVGELRSGESGDWRDEHVHGDAVEDGRGDGGAIEQQR